MFISAIIPAYNEQKTIYNLVRVIRASQIFNEVIVVDDGSKDRTAYLAKLAGATVINLPENNGKGGALAAGVKISRGDILLFFDADLSGVRKKHLEDLIRPVQNGEADMVIGIQPKYKDVYAFNDSIPVISGQRALRRDFFTKVPEDLLKGYQVEEALNYYAKTADKKVKVVVLEGLAHLQKIAKSNFLIGILGYIKMDWQLTKIFVWVRILRLFRKRK